MDPSERCGKQRVYESQYRPAAGDAAPNMRALPQLKSNDKDERMLSPREFATLMLVKNASYPFDLSHEDLDALLTHQLIALDKELPGQLRPYVTHHGEAVLRSVARARCEFTLPK